MKRALSSLGASHIASLTFVLSMCAIAAAPAMGQVSTTPTMDTQTLQNALGASGLTITSLTIVNGVAGQFGTYSNFDRLPVTIRPGIVLSSGHVADLTPIANALDPGYDPASPPEKVNTQMVLDPESGGTPEFDEYGSTAGNIENFNGSFDVAALRVDFSLEDDSAVKFDFLFGSVEYPFWTSQFTDSFLVFLDGTTPADQITFDAAGNAVQVGSSFQGLETSADQNTAFSEPHGIIHHLTTTTPVLGGGDHFLIFEVGDVNDHILDSAAFITGLRAETGPPGTGETEDPPYANCPQITSAPRDATVCNATSAQFAVGAVGVGTLSYQWEIRAAQGIWQEFGSDPTSLPCGGFAHATTPNNDSTAISISPCSGQSIYRVRCKVSNACGDVESQSAMLVVADSCCDSIDFNNDTSLFDPIDIDAFLSVFGEGPCIPDTAICNHIDFNNDGSLFDPCDIDSFLLQFGEGPCTLCGQ